MPFRLVRLVRLLVLAGLLGAMLFPTVAAGHESQPGLLELRQLAPDRWEVVWRAPIYYGKPHPARPELPSDWQPVAEPTVRQLADSALHRQVVSLDGSAFDGSLIRFPGLEATITDVFVRVSRLDGSESSQVVRPTKPYPSCVERVPGPPPPASMWCSASTTSCSASITCCLSSGC